MTVQEQVSTGLDRPAFVRTLDFLHELGLLSAAEMQEVLSVLEPDFPFATALREASSVHVHSKVEDTRTLPHDRILEAGGRPESQVDGYVKYRFDGGLNMIFSSINISEDDLLPGEPMPDLPAMDHKGIDLRRDTEAVRAAFGAVPELALGQGWRHVPQGGEGQPVYCCHTEVEGKHWVYPPQTGAHTRPIEFAVGDLQIHDAKMGCDLRPIDPAHPRAAEARAALSACAAAHAEGEEAAAEPAAGSSYYERADLAHFADMGAHAKPLMDRFWAYYNATFAVDGALTKREKALIALAVAHAKQCPYCIDAYSNSCLDNGATVEQMHEAVHCAAALGAGIDLVHGVQMQNALRARGAM
jgi:alkylhydroperoxidase/carboxymuconolactone decarboxylase family protein